MESEWERMTVSRIQVISGFWWQVMASISLDSREKGELMVFNGL